MAEKKLREQVRDIARLRHLSLRTEEAYWGWIKRFILFHRKRHPREMGSPEITAFLTHLAVESRVASSTQNQAFNALLFLYRQVLKLDMPDISNTVRARQARRLPVVLTREESEAVLARLTHANRLIASLLYGSGMRLMEAINTWTAANQTLKLRNFGLPLKHRTVAGREGVKRSEAECAPAPS